MSGIFGDAVFGAARQRSAYKSVEWYTPPWIFELLDIGFDLDPASPHDQVTAVPATRTYTVFDNGLAKPWFGRVWLNPPYSRKTPVWVRRMIEHRHGIMLVFSRTDAAWFQEAMVAADAMLLVKGRLDFVPGLENAHKRSRAGAGTALFAFGRDCAAALANMSDRGVYISQGADHHKILKTSLEN